MDHSPAFLALVADALAKMGYRRLASMAGGWRRWRELGFPTAP